MSYSIALEMQQAALRWVNSSKSREWFDACEEAAAQSGDAFPEHPGGWTETEVKNRIRLPLEDAEVYYWSPQICQMLQQASAAMPDMTLRSELMPTWNGYLWFGSPLSDRGEYPPDLVAMTWATVTAGSDDPSPTVLITPWFRNENCISGLPVGGVAWDIGKTAESGGGYGPLVPSTSDAVIWCLKLFGSMLAFMDQRILVSRAERPDRSLRRRLSRDGWTHEPLIRVVQLRRTANQNASREHSNEAVEWSCQWVVRGHWRQQACGPNHSERRPVFVLPYVKGPEDAPLKTSADRVFAVVR